LRTLAFIALASAALAQVAPPSTAFLRRDSISIFPSLRSDPPASALRSRFVPYLRSQAPPGGPAFYTRIFVDRTNHTYLGYELLLEEKQRGAYQATVGKLGVTPIDLAASLSPSSPIDLEWTLLPLPGIPPARTVPTVSGEARDFSAADAEFQILQPRAVFLNGALEGAPILRNIRGPLVWIYLPKHGRYILSLAPRPGLDFIKAGEVRGGVISFTIGGDSIRLESNMSFAVGDAPYNLWILHDEEWEPISEAQKNRPGIGSVGAAELVALKRK
jgi:hypothetical protein